MTNKELIKRLNAGETISEIAKELGQSNSAIYMRISRLKEANRLEQIWILKENENNIKEVKDILKGGK